MAESVAEAAIRLISSAGISGCRLEWETHAPEVFGNGQALFSFQGILMLFTRDRGQIFLDLKHDSSAAPFVNANQVFAMLNDSASLPLSTHTAPDDLLTALTQIEAHSQDVRSLLASLTTS